LVPAIVKLALTGLSFFLENAKPFFPQQLPHGGGSIAHAASRESCGMVDGRRTRVPTAHPETLPVERRAVCKNGR
jgi:hypothetical protein